MKSTKPQTPEEQKKLRERQIKATENYVMLIKKEIKGRQLEMEMYSKYLDRGEFEKTFVETAKEHPMDYPEYKEWVKLANEVGTYNGVETARVAQLQAQSKLKEAEENLNIAKCNKK